MDGISGNIKRLLDRVLSYGFAYQNENNISVGLLGNKKIQQFITMGNSIEKYQQLGFDKALKSCLVDGLFNFCGITDIQHDIFGNIHLLDETDRQTILISVFEKTFKNLTALYLLRVEINARENSIKLFFFN